MNSLKIILSQFSETRMLLMEYLFMRGEEIPDYAKNSIWNLLHAYIDAYSQILIDEFPGDGVQAISIFSPQCANITLSCQSRYIRIFHKVVHT